MSHEPVYDKSQTTKTITVNIETENGTEVATIDVDTKLDPRDVVYKIRACFMEDKDIEDATVCW